MPYLLDTNHCSYIINGVRKSPAFQKAEEVKTIQAFRAAADTVYSCDVVAGEMYYGAELNSNRDELTQLVDRFLLTATPLVADHECWRLFARTKAQLRSSGKVMADFDLLIASIAARYGCILVSNDNVFQHLPDGPFRVENWAA